MNITVDRDILDKVLHTLEQHLPLIEDWGDNEELNRQHEAITALRTALGHPEPKPMPPELRKALEDYFDKCFRREPLTEKDIGKLWDSTMKYTLSIDRLMAFARKIEAAHGIKEPT